MSLSAREIARMRADAEVVLNDSASIYRNTKSSNGQGGHTSSWAQVASSDFDCLLAPLKDQRQDEIVADRNAKVVRRILTYPSSVTLGLTDRVSVQSGMWDVVRLLEPRSINVVNRAEIARVV